MAAISSSSANSNNSNGVCLTSIRIIHLHNQLIHCMKCFANILVDPDQYELQISHQFTFIYGPYDKIVCAICNNDVVTTRPSEQCFLCTQKYSNLLSQLPGDDTDLSNIAFRLNIFTDTFEEIVST